MTYLATLPPELNDAGRLTFRRDHHLRRRFFVERSFEHKARVNLFWLAWLLDQYTQPGDLVLDPLGGAGSILLAATKQRRVITGDVEANYARMMLANARKIGGQLFSEPTQIARWDAGRLPLPDRCVDAVVTSPPYFDLFSDWNAKSSGADIHGDHIGPTGQCYGFDPRQIGNVHVYEDYLRTMRAVYAECIRVLRPGGKIVLIVGDKVRRGGVVPVVHDTQTLLLALGAWRWESHVRQTRPSRYRRIHAQQQGPDYPLLDSETALVFMPGGYAWTGYNYTGRRVAIIQAPRPDSAPGRQLFEKQFTYALWRSDTTIILTSAGFQQINDEFIPVPGPNAVSLEDLGPNLLSPDVTPNLVWSGDHGLAAERREWSFGVVRELVRQGIVRAGDTVELHVSLTYARYLQRRLRTLGAVATIPTARHNLGQKLAWYTERLEDAR